MTLTEWPSVIFIGLSLGSLLVSLVSLVVAFNTKQEVKRAARLEGHHHNCLDSRAPDCSPYL
jgi:hypothetical protein